MRRVWQEILEPRQQAQLLNLSYSTVSRWLKQFRDEGLRGLLPAAAYLREPYTPERIIVSLAGWFRLRGYLLKDHGIELGQTTLKKLMKLNRRLHLVPKLKSQSLKLSRKNRHCEVKNRSLTPLLIFGIWMPNPMACSFISCLLHKGCSRTILTGSLTDKQHVGIILRLYYLALLQWGAWQTIVSDNGGQFRSIAFAKANHGLGISQHFCEKGRPWQNLIESQFGIQARMGEYLWRNCANVEQAIDIHRELIRNHNRLPHFAHRKREDGKETPLEILGNSRGRRIEAADLHQAFSRQVWQRRTNEKGFIRVGRWKIYVEEGLPKTPVELIYWDGKLRAEYRQTKLAEYNCRWDDKDKRPKTIEKLEHFVTQYSSKQPELFGVGWHREPIEEIRAERKASKTGISKQLKLPVAEVA